MTGGASASATVRIHPTDTTVRPGIGIKFAVLHIFDLASVTLSASVGRGWAALDYLPQHIVQRSDELCCLGMMTLFELFYFLGVTAPAVVGCDNHGNALAVVLKRCGIFVIGTMARVAVHVPFGVRAFSPLLHNAGRAATVAIEACLAFYGYLGTNNCGQWKKETTEKN